MKRFVSVVAASALIALSAQSALAQEPYLIQSFLAPGGASILSSFTWGGYLSNGPYTFSLYGFDGSRLTTPVLWSQAMTNTVTYDDVQRLFPNAPITGGAQYAIGVDHVYGQLITTDVVPNAQAYVDEDFDGDYTAYWRSSDADGFSITFDTTTTPEPSSLVLVATALLAYAAVRRRRVS
jgi:hypothetical protein